MFRFALDLQVLRPPRPPVQEVWQAGGGHGGGGVGQAGGALREGQEERDAKYMYILSHIKKKLFA